MALTRRFAPSERLPSSRLHHPPQRQPQNGGGDGAGLGLALARRLARAASGDVEALPSDNGGRFAVSLPTA